MTAFITEHAGPAQAEDRAPSQAHREAVLDRAFEEYCLRRQAGEAVDVESFCAAYPGHRSSLRRMVCADEMLRAAPSLLDGEAPGERMPESAWPRVGGALGDFRLRRVLGKGSFARVYLATEASAGDRPVAVKVTTAGGDEARLQGRLHHDHIVPVLWAGHDSATGLHVVCMPFLGSATLLNVLDRAFPAAGAAPPVGAAVIGEAIAARTLPGDPVPDQILAGPDLAGRRYAGAVAALAAPLAEALAFLHGRGTAHCDLKPSNVLLTPAGRPLLLDFNLSRSAEQTRSRVGGTFAYMAPEAVRAWLDEVALPGRELAAADVYSLGAVLYELLTGRPPAGAPPAGPPVDMARWQLLNLGLPVVGVRDRNPAVPGALARLIERCLSAQPQLRPSAAEAARALKKIARPSRRWPLAVAAMFLLAGAVLAAAAPPPRRGEAQPEPPAAGHRAAARAQLAAGRVEIGRQKRDRGEIALRKADEFFQKAIEQHKKETGEKQGLWEDLFGRGRVQMLLGNWAEAQSYFSAARQARALRAGPGEDARLAACRAYCFAAAKQHEMAIELYELAVAGGLATAAVRNNLAYSYLSTAQFDKADRRLKEALRLQPDLMPALRNRAELGLRRQRRAKVVPGAVLREVDRVIALVDQGGAPADVYLWAARAHAGAMNAAGAALDAAEKARRVERVRELVLRGCALGAQPGGVVRDRELKLALGGWLTVDRLPVARQTEEPAHLSYLEDPLGGALE